MPVPLVRKQWRTGLWGQGNQDCREAWQHFGREELVSDQFQSDTNMIIYSIQQCSNFPKPKYFLALKVISVEESGRDERENFSFRLKLSGVSSLLMPLSVKISSFVNEFYLSNLLEICCYYHYLVLMDSFLGDDFCSQLHFLWKSLLVCVGTGNEEPLMWEQMLPLARQQRSSVLSTLQQDVSF